MEYTRKYRTANTKFITFIKQSCHTVYNNTLLYLFFIKHLQHNITVTTRVQQNRYKCISTKSCINVQYKNMNKQVYICKTRQPQLQKQSEELIIISLVRYIFYIITATKKDIQISRIANRHQHISWGTIFQYNNTLITYT